MRSLSSEALAKITQAKGTEPIIVVEVDWGTSPVSYADRDMPGALGRILNLANLDNIIDVKSSASQSIDVTLDDTDGTIKAILDTEDVHQRTARVWQHFHGLDADDRFLLFAGKVTSPIVWSEADRTVTFTILSQLEDREFGFSAEEGEFPYVPKDLVGKPWPVIFGKCLDVPALQVNTAVSGSTLCGVGILSGEALHNAVPTGGTDCALGTSLAMMQQNISFLQVVSGIWVSWRPKKPNAKQLAAAQAKAAQLLSQANDLRASLSSTINAQAQQLVCAAQQRKKTLDDAKATGLGCNPVRILGGEDFPQNTTITLNINGGLFTGRMSNDSFHISSRRHPDNDARAQELFDGIAASQCETPTPLQKFDFQMEVPPGTGNGNSGGSFFGGSGGIGVGGSTGSSTYRHHGFVVCNTPQKSRPSTPQVAQHFWADAGSRVVIASDEPIAYIASITPGTVLAVKAFKTLGGVRKLVNVPNNLYTVRTTAYGTITATEVVVNRPLSTIVDQGWEDDIYVTFESTIGPDTVEILEWIIDNYTDLDYDTTSFDSVRVKLEPFPSNFPVLDRRNTIDLIRDIAFQARCAVWLSNGVFYLKYLPEEPDSDATITVSDIEATSAETEWTETESITTKMVVTWHLSWADDKPPRIILRNNEEKYGVKSEDFDWFIYNQPDIVLKAATFWLIRKSNTWKKLRFNGFLNLLNLETFDTVALDLPPYVASGPVKAIIEKADYDSESNSLAFECLTPVRAGSNVAYEWFWPSANPDEFIPTGPTSTVGGSLPIGTVPATGTGSVFVGGPNVIFLRGSHRGDRRPGDVGFVAQTIIPGTVFADVDARRNPNPNLNINYVDPIKPPPLATIPAGEPLLEIDIRGTTVVDSDNPGQASTLDDLLRIRQDQLVIRTQSEFFDGENQAAFSFEYDTEETKFGADIAYLGP